jgi:hypothetical protein
MLPPGAYVITTSARMTADEASEGIFPDTAAVVHVATDVKGRTVSYTYLVDYPEAP